MAINKIVLMIVIFSSLNVCLDGLFNLNLIKNISSMFGGSQNIIEKILSIVILVSLIIFAINPDLYEPYNSETCMPQPKEDIEPNGNLKMTNIRKLPPFAKVVYWGSIPKQDINEVADNEAIAYDIYQNSGIATATYLGDVSLRYVQPIAYKDKSGKIIPPHIKYRYWLKDKGMFSKIYKVYLTNK